MASIGVEPIRPFGQRILSPARLPIPPRGRAVILGAKMAVLIAEFKLDTFNHRQSAPSNTSGKCRLRSLPYHDRRAGIATLMRGAGESKMGGAGLWANYARSLEHC